MDLFDVDMQFMTNTTYRDKTEPSSSTTNPHPYTKKDMKFYKKRILYMFREMTKHPKKINSLPLSLQQSFHNCVYQYIEHFKELDTYDELQSAFDISWNKDNDTSIQSCENLEKSKKRENKHEHIEDANSFLYANEIVLQKHKTMKDFCIQKKKTIQKPVFPVQKSVVLHDKKYKYKGLPTSMKKQCDAKKTNKLIKKK